MLNADIVTGIALMLWFSRFADCGYVSILLAHVTFNIPYVVLSILPADEIWAQAACRHFSVVYSASERFFHGGDDVDG
ncbi:MAG: hypothetical protein V8R14_06455 [Clostridia bacterium]